MSSERVILRAHHGMCLAYFIGEGYSGGFTAHMSRVLAALTPDTPVQLTAAVDMVCAACPNNLGGVCVTDASAAGYDRAVLERCGLAEGAEMTFGAFTALVQERILGPGLRREICGGCQWDGICSRQSSRWAVVRGAGPFFRAF